MLVSRKRTFFHIAIWTAAVIVGIAAVIFARTIAVAQEIYFHWFLIHSYYLTAATPLLFVLSTTVIKKFAPKAGGSGIPQVLEAIEHAKIPDSETSIWLSSLVSMRTASFKVVSMLIGILGGASIGREGPTVQIASSVFAWVGRRLRKYFPELDFQSFLTAGAAAGVAAAFNTPLAGITFALEEIAEGSFAPFREITMLSVVIAGISGQALFGDYLYFGHPTIPKPSAVIIPIALFLGILGGLSGGFFSMLLSDHSLLPLPKIWWKRALFCGIICAAIGLWTGGDTAGSGYEVTRKSLESISVDGVDVGLPFYKFVTTVFSYLSGMAGGIFSPCLSIGAGLGLTTAKLFQLVDFKACALLGMVAFFSGVVQAPLTAVVIVTEMTDEHTLILLFMVAAFVARGVGALLMPVPLYRYLADKRS